jgi:hypothetical protein
MSDDDRRAGIDRRSGKDRRSGLDTRSEEKKRLQGERRSNSDRRSGLDRRSEPMHNDPKRSRGRDFRPHELIVWSDSCPAEQLLADYLSCLNTSSASR